MDIYTRRGDDGTTGLLHGGRVRKDSAVPEVLGSIDEAQAAIGVARAHADRELAEILTATAADVWTVMAVFADSGVGRNVVDSDQLLGDRVRWLETTIDAVVRRFEMPRDFVIPGATVPGAHLDVARAAVRRAERRAVSLDRGHTAVMYLNRLSDLLWALARWQDGEQVLAKNVATRPT